LVTPDIDDEKRRLRAEAKRRRAAAAAAAPGAGEALCRRLIAALDQGTMALARGAAVSAYWPKGDELDPRPAMSALVARGHPIGLPVVAAQAAPLVFRRWAPGDRLEPAGFGLYEPAGDRPELTPELLLVPLLAFDRSGTRLGYGGGFYDRTLAGLQSGGRALAVGIAYAGQELPELPRGSRDRALDWIVTEGETIAIGDEGHAAAVLR
jgi:5-formyltetrahydrofolate cyclo-ligase